VQRLQKQAERIGEWLKANDPKYVTTGKEISSNLTDNDSAKMKTAHGVIQGYNSQALVDGKHQVIVHAQAFGRGQDHAHGPPMLDGALENLESLGPARSTLPERSSPLTPTITATSICGNTRNWAWVLISLTGFSAGETPAMLPKVVTGLSGKGLS
jgi:hypothetical protein